MGNWRTDMAHPKYFSDTDKEEIFRLYERGCTYSEIARMYGIDRSVVTKLLIRNGYARRSMSGIKRKYTLNEDYFDFISENQAYVVGLLFADGSNNTSRGEVVLQLQEGDKGILDKISKELLSNKPLRLVTLKNPNHCRQIRLCIASRKISNELKEMGMVHDKTYTLTYPDWLSIEQQRHFIRGYIDGDGYTSKNEISFVGTTAFCDGVANVFLDILGVSASMRSRGGKGIHVEGRVSGRLQCRKVYEWLYTDAELFLDRKYKVAMDSLSFPGSRKKPIRLCSADNCYRKHHANGFCQLHNYRAKHDLDFTVARGT
jgi:hypothetical protein